MRLGFGRFLVLFLKRAFFCHAIGTAGMNCPVAYALLMPR